MEKKDELLKIFSKEIRQLLGQVEIDFEKVQEIRLRINAPLLLVYQNQEYCLSSEGRLSKEFQSAYIVSRNELKETMEHLSSYSLYAFEEEMKQGFITISGGHRIGLSGKTILDQSGVKGMKFISFLNVRLSHQVKGCADPVLPYIYERKEILHTLIISPPRCGKTTLLRDMIRQISDGNSFAPGVTVGVVDERSEIGACYQGGPQNDLGIRTDVLDCCPKAKGMMMLIRTMSPQVIAVDEIGSREDLDAIEYVMNCGCKLLATVHGSSMADIAKKPVLRQLMAARAFQRYLILTNRKQVGDIAGVYDEEGKSIVKTGT